MNENRIDGHGLCPFIQAVIVSPTGWANVATIDAVYDLLHMMGRDDILVGLGDVFAMNQSDPDVKSVGDCKYTKAIPQGSGGFLDSDTLYGLARDMPRSPRRCIHCTFLFYASLCALIIWCYILIFVQGIQQKTL